MKTKTADILNLIRQDTTLTWEASTKGGEYSGPCPFCGGDDRFRVWPEPPSGKPGYWCRKCGVSGDAIQYVRDREGVGYLEACQRLGVEPKEKYKKGGGGTGTGPKPVMTDRWGGNVKRDLEGDKKESRSKMRYEPAEAPGKEWQERGRVFVQDSIDRLWKDIGRKALDWLKERGFKGETIREARLGYNDQERYEDPGRWGLDREKQIYLPRGIVIPWEIEEKLWRINIRRPVPPESDETKYIGPAGFSTGRLYRADRIQMNDPVLIVEGELDALIILQEAGNVVVPIATGATSHGRSLDSFTDLAGTGKVLVSFDPDSGGEEAAKFWIQKIEGAKRWRPYWGDPNEMHSDGCDVRNWINAGLKGYVKNNGSPSVDDNPEPGGDRGPSGLSGSRTPEEKTKVQETEARSREEWIPVSEFADWLDAMIARREQKNFDPYSNETIT